MNHNNFIKTAIEYAKKSVDAGEYPFGAIVVKDGKIVGDSLTLAFSEKAASLCHAETTAIIHACENLNTDNLSDCILYSSCKPCGFCMGAAKWVGIKEIYYAMDKQDAKLIGYENQIFADDFIKLNENKIDVPDFLQYMKNWYDSK